MIWILAYVGSVILSLLLFKLFNKIELKRNGYIYDDMNGVFIALSLVPGLNLLMSSVWLGMNLLGMLFNSLKISSFWNKLKDLLN